MSMSDYGSWKAREPEDADARKPTAGDEEPAEWLVDLPPCAKCGKLPSDCVWMCRACGTVAEVIPYPVIGCQCIAAAYVCDACQRGGE